MEAAPTWYSLESRIRTYLASDSIFSIVYKLCARVPQFIKFHDLSRSDLFVNQIRNSPENRTILLQTMSTYDLYPRTISKEDIYHVAYHNQPCYVALVFDTTVMSEVIFERMRDYFLDYRLLRVYLQLCSEIPGFLTDIIPKFINRDDNQTVKDFVDALKLNVEYTHQLLAIVTEINSSQTMILNDSITRYRQTIPDSLRTKYIKIIEQVRQAYQQEIDTCTLFLCHHVKTDILSKLYMQLWSLSPELDKILTPAQRASLQKSNDFIDFFAIRPYYGDYITYLIAKFIQPEVKMPKLSEDITFTSMSEVEKICTEIKRQFSSIPVPGAVTEMPTQQDACTMCRVYTKSSVIVPCGHNVICVECARDYILKLRNTTCPSCHKPIEKIITLVHV